MSPGRLGVVMCLSVLISTEHKHYCSGSTETVPSFWFVT